MTTAQPCHRLEIKLQPLEPQDLPRLKEEVSRLLGGAVELRNMVFARYGKGCTVVIHTVFPHPSKPGPGLPLPQLKLLISCTSAEELEGLVRSLGEVGAQFYVSEVS